jgi:hypothetical protein
MNEGEDHSPRTSDLPPLSGWDGTRAGRSRPWIEATTFRDGSAESGTEDTVTEVLKEKENTINKHPSFDLMSFCPSLSFRSRTSQFIPLSGLGRDRRTEGGIKPSNSTMRSALESLRASDGVAPVPAMHRSPPPGRVASYRASAGSVRGDGRLSAHDVRSPA